MDIVFEILFELILEGIFGLTIKNPKVKTWIKTAVFLLITEALSGFLLWLSFSFPEDGATGGDIIVRVISIAMAVGFLIMAISGHRRDWKQARDW